MSLINWIDFQILGDERGSLVAMEQGKNIPFEIRRVYYIYRTEKGVSRGFHAHKNLKQVAICMSGSCDFILDNGLERETVTINCPTRGLFVEGLIWREMHNFSEDCVLLVLASEYYDESDYIRSYEEFTKKVSEA